MSNEMHPDLEWLARNVSKWPHTAQNGIIVRHSRSGLSGGGIVAIAKGWGNDNPDFFSFNGWLQARKDLGLIMTDEEESMPSEEWSTTITDTPEEAAMVEDMVNHPPHYQSDNGIECIDAIRAALGLDGFVAHCRGTAIKYCWRSGKKQSHAEDLRKAAWYLNEAADALEEDNE